jgi:hypothetical protein
MSLRYTLALVLVCGGCADSRESAGDPNSIWQDGSEDAPDLGLCFP